MASALTFRQVALSFPGATEQPHFEKTSFRIRNKIFATLDERAGIACLMLSPIDQSVFCAHDKEIMYPVPNKWGQQGATFVGLKKIRKSMLKDALTHAYNKAAYKTGKVTRNTQQL
jgi:predicted DNA-binding protein (MmcQ/YjbR family)